MADVIFHLPSKLGGKLHAAEPMEDCRLNCYLFSIASTVNLARGFFMQRHKSWLIPGLLHLSL